MVERDYPNVQRNMVRTIELPEYFNNEVYLYLDSILPAWRGTDIVLKCTKLPLKDLHSPPAARDELSPRPDTTRS
jgi:hypothetical protein